MNTRLTLCLWATLAALGLASLEGNAANIAGKAKADTKAAKSNTAQHHAALTNVLHELHQAKHLLDLGLHDYHGHRAKADGEIRHAIHLLEHHHTHKKSSTTTTHPAKAALPIHHGPITDEQQHASDQKLRRAEKLVHAALHQLHHLHAQHKEHHHIEKAMHVLREAAHEIEAALHVVHHYHKHLAAAAKK